MNFLNRWSRVAIAKPMSLDASAKHLQDSCLIDLRLLDGAVQHHYLGADPTVREGT
jgi:hypothetical protein